MTSICFKPCQLIGLETKKIIELLLQKIVGACQKATPRTLQIKAHHLNFLVIHTIDLYSASALARDTIDCFLDIYVMRFGRRKIHAPMTDLFVTGSST